MVHGRTYVPLCFAAKYALNLLQVALGYQSIMLCFQDQELAVGSYPFPTFG